MRGRSWVSGTLALRPLARHLAGHHGLAAPHTGSWTVPLQQGAQRLGPVPPLAPRDVCWGGGASGPGEEGGAGAQARSEHTAVARGRSPASPRPGPHAVDGSSSTPVPAGPRAAVLLRGRGWAGGDTWCVWGSEGSLSQEAQRAESWNSEQAWGRVPGDGGGGRDARPSVDKPAHSFRTPLPARPLGHLLVQRGGQRAGKGQHLGRVGGEEVWPR